ncbi:MAG: hypothetical protein Fur0024_5540 [Patescibacteria group bacterium]
MKKKLEKIGKILKFIPFVRFSFFSSVREDSDIDLLIISQKNRVWLSRIFSSIIFKVFGLKKTKHQKIGKVCLNFFLEDGFLIIRPKMDYEISYFRSLQESTEASRIYKKNFDLSTIFFYGKKFNSENLSSQNFILTRLINKIFSLKIFDFLENLAKNLQRKRILKKMKSRKMENGIIVLTKREIRFHELSKNYNFKD